MSQYTSYPILHYNCSYVDGYKICLNTPDPILHYNCSYVDGYKICLNTPAIRFSIHKISDIVCTVRQCTSFWTVLVRLYASPPYDNSVWLWYVWFSNNYNHAFFLPIMTFAENGKIVSWLLLQFQEYMFKSMLHKSPVCECMQFTFTYAFFIWVVYRLLAWMGILFKHLGW